MIDVRCKEFLSLLNVEMFGSARAGSTAKSDVEWQIPACDVSHASNCLYVMLCVLIIADLCGVDVYLKVMYVLLFVVLAYAWLLSGGVTTQTPQMRCMTCVSRLLPRGGDL